MTLESPFKPIAVYGPYDNLDIENRVATIQGRTYHFANYNPPYRMPESKVEFHKVLFTISYGFIPSGCTVINPVFEFEDGTIERTSRTEPASRGGIRMIAVAANSQKPIVTVLSHHLHPQAGVTLWQKTGRLKLLVSSD